MKNFQPFVIERKSKANLMSFLFAIWVITIGVIGSFSLLIASVALPIRMNLFFIPLVMIAVLGIRLLLWLIFGKEIIYVEQDKITCKKSGTFFLPEKVFKSNTILKFELALTFVERENGFDGLKGLVTEMSYRYPYFRIINSGRIRIVYNGNSYNILNGISYEEGKELVKKLNEFYQKT